MRLLAYTCSVFKLIIFIAFFSLLTGFQKPAELVKGAKAPDFVATTIDGDTIKLSSLTNSLVYVDFWASWCLPCRKQNIALVKLQEKYKLIGRRKGLRIVFISISLDTNKELWKVAIAKDNLNWKSQICDFMGWASPLAKSYQIKKIPSSFFIGKEGIILEKDVWGEDLDKAIDNQYQQLSN